MITIITGERGTGKTTFLMKLIRKLKENSTVGGIITPAEYRGNQKIKIGFNALDLQTNKSWLLGRIGEDLGGPSVGPFSFSREGLDRAISVFRETVIKSPDYIFLDEIGPLELEKQEGFFPIVSLFPELPERIHLYLVVRPDLVDKVIKKYLPGKPVRILSVTAANRDSGDLMREAMNV